MSLITLSFSSGIPAVYHRRKRRYDCLNMSEFEEAISEVNRHLEAAATDAVDISDLSARNAVENILRSMRDLTNAVRSLSSR
jgi:hypothetical protein